MDFFGSGILGDIFFWIIFSFVAMIAIVGLLFAIILVIFSILGKMRMGQSHKYFEEQEEISKKAEDEIQECSKCKRPLFYNRQKKRWFCMTCEDP